MSVRVDAQRILIVLLGAIGDVVRALPLANRVRAAFPDAHLAWAVEPRSAPILEAHPALDDRLVFERRGGARAFLAFLRRVRAERFDLVLDLQRHAKSGLVSAASRAPVRVGFHRTNAKELNWLWNTHTIPPVEARGWKLDQYQRFGDFLELPEMPPRFEVTLTDAERRRVDEILAPIGRPFAALFLGSTWESRLWFADRYAALVHALDAAGLDAVLVGGTDASPSDRTRGRCTSPPPPAHRSSPSGARPRPRARRRSARRTSCSSAACRACRATSAAARSAVSACATSRSTA
jgi:heptosyltransferase-1